MFKFFVFLTLVMMLALAGGALAGETEWTFYGVAHASINSLGNGEDSQIGVTSNTSRFGFRGAHALNEDFTAFWQFESLLDLTGANSQTISVPTYVLEPGETEGEYELVESSKSVAVKGTTLATRNTFVGVKHKDMGSFMVGRHDTPFKSLGRKVEVFPDQLGDHRAVTQGWDRRLTEIAAWKSPDWSGFGLFAAYQFDQADMGAEEGKTAMSAMASYATEQFMLGVAYEAFSTGHGKTTGTGAEMRYGDGPTAVRAAARYMADQFELVGLYQSATEQMWAGDTPAISEWTYTTMGAGAIFHANEKWDVKGAFYMLDKNTDAADDADTPDFDESDTQATMMAFGIERIFTKNASVYAQFATISNGDATNIALGGSDSGFGLAPDGITGATIIGDGNPLTDDDTHENPIGFSVGTVVNW